jgi:PAS domain S-box-containing protein
MGEFSDKTDPDYNITVMGVSNFHAQILDAVNQAVIATDLEGTVVYWNRFAERLYGWRTDEAIGRQILELTTPEMSAEQGARIMRQLLDGKEWEGEFIVRRRDGTRFLAYVTDSPIYDREQKIIGVVGFSTDIDKQKQAQTALRESEESLRLLVESASEYAIFTVTKDNLIDSWNTGAERIFGYREAEIIGESGTILYTPEDRAENIPEQEIQTALRTGRAEDERWHVRRDGTRFYASGMMQPMRDGKLEGFVKIARDMTQKVQADKNLRDKEILQKLVGALENERKIIARDLHDELGQQLTALRLNLDYMRSNTGDEKLRRQIDDLQETAQKIDEGVDFLSWELRPAALDEFGLLPAIGKFVREWSKHTGIGASFFSAGLERSRFPSEVEINLYRVVQEALNNVGKHAEATLVEVTIEKPADVLVLIIEDNGKGFLPEEKPNAERGIGLLGMRERATLIAGTFAIESVPGSGTALYFRVPVSVIEEVDKNDE